MIIVKSLVFRLLSYWVIAHIYPYIILVFYIYFVNLFYLIYNFFRVFCLSWYQSQRNPDPKKNSLSSFLFFIKIPLHLLNHHLPSHQTLAAPFFIVASLQKGQRPAATPFLLSSDLQTTATPFFHCRLPSKRSKEVSPSPNPSQELSPTLQGSKEVLQLLKIIFLELIWIL